MRAHNCLKLLLVLDVSTDGMIFKIKITRKEMRAHFTTCTFLLSFLSYHTTQHHKTSHITHIAQSTNSKTPFIQLEQMKNQVPQDARAYNLVNSIQGYTHVLNLRHSKISK